MCSQRLAPLRSHPPMHPRTRPRASARGTRAAAQSDCNTSECPCAADADVVPSVLAFLTSDMGRKFSVEFKMLEGEPPRIGAPADQQVEEPPSPSSPPLGSTRELRARVVVVARRTSPRSPPSDARAGGAVEEAVVLRLEGGTTGASALAFSSTSQARQRQRSSIPQRRTWPAFPVRWRRTKRG